MDLVLIALWWLSFRSKAEESRFGLPEGSRYWVYLMAGRSKVLYCGMTNNLRRRVAEHKGGNVEGFTKRYHCHFLVWFEEYGWVHDAIAREKEIKNWRRDLKIELIERTNPGWRDLSLDWYPGVENRDSSASLRNDNKTRSGIETAEPATAIKDLR